jgi:hypothetical protein
MRNCFHLTVFLCAFAATCVFTGCSKPTPESVMTDMNAKLAELTDVLKGVTDADSAKAAVPKVQAIAADMKKLREQAEALKISKEDAQKVADAHKDQLMKTQKEFQDQMARIAFNQELMGPLSPAFKELGKSMSLAMR